jgi:spore coat protein A
MRASPRNAAKTIPYYRIAIREFEQKVHRDVKPAKMWGYAGSFPGPTFESRKGEEVLVEWANELPKKHFLPIDHNMHGAERDLPEVRVVSHLHAGKRRVPGELVHARKIGNLPLSKRPGCGDALVPRSHHGH